MDISEIKKGMLVECQQGVGKVLVVDEQSRSLLVEHSDTHQQMAVEADDLIDNPQLHTGCDKYY